MRSKKSIFQRIAFATALLSGGALAERVIDPFDRLENNIVLEWPTGHSEVFYISPNYYDEAGEKNDDIPGNVLLVLGISSFAIAIAVSANREHQTNN